MRFLNPVHTMKRLEIVRGVETSEDTLATAVELGRRMGKETVVIREQEPVVGSR
jgi:3-hydroxybutyryl-CoA dehydrogenase